MKAPKHLQKPSIILRDGFYLIDYNTREIIDAQDDMDINFASKWYSLKHNNIILKHLKHMIEKDTHTSFYIPKQKVGKRRVAIVPFIEVGRSYEIGDTIDEYMKSDEWVALDVVKGDILGYYSSSHDFVTKQGLDVDHMNIRDTMNNYNYDIIYMYTDTKGVASSKSYWKFMYEQKDNIYYGNKYGKGMSIVNPEDGRIEKVFPDMATALKKCGIPNEGYVYRMTTPIRNHKNTRWIKYTSKRIKTLKPILEGKYLLWNRHIVKNELLCIHNQDIDVKRERLIPGTHVYTPDQYK